MRLGMKEVRSALELCYCSGQFWANRFPENAGREGQVSPELPL